VAWCLSQAIFRQFCASYAFSIRLGSSPYILNECPVCFPLTFPSSRYSSAVAMSVEKLPNDLNKTVTPTETEHVEVLPVDSADSEKYHNDRPKDLETADGGAYSTVSFLLSSPPQSSPCLT
jgi:hypothetical protein